MHYALARSPFLPTAILMAVLALLLTAGPADAASKSTCNGAVCEEVIHTGSTVTSWKTTVYPGSGYNCRTARFWVNDGLIASKQVCGTGGLVAYANTPYTLAAGSKLCASWANESGYACVTI